MPCGDPHCTHCDEAPDMSVAGGKSDSYVKGYGQCFKCGFTYPTYNMYGMGVCSHCGWYNRPHVGPGQEALDKGDWSHDGCQDPNCKLYVRPTEEDLMMTELDLTLLASAIEEGRWDEHLGALSGLIQARQKKRRDELLALVQEVYGPNATIQTTRPGDFSSSGQPRGTYVN